VVTRGLLLNPPRTAEAPARGGGGGGGGGGGSSCSLLPGQNAMFGEWPSPGIANLSALPDAASCQAACAASANCTAFIYYDPAGPFGAAWDGRCFIRTDGRFRLTPEAATTSGACAPAPQPRNVYVADLAAGGTPLPAALTAPREAVLTLLVATAPGVYQRPIRARWPDCDPELCQWPAGWATGGAWTPPAPDFNTSVSHVPFPDNSPGMNRDYWQGQGGPCAALLDGDGPAGPANVNASYWCQENGRVGTQYFFRQPRGLTLTRAELPHAPYAAAPANGAVLHYWRPAHWYSAFARVGAAATDPATSATALEWTYGGFHGAEGTDAGEDWYLSHVREELDAAREFFFDASEQRLYYFHNASAGTPPPREWAFEAPLLAVLVNVSGAPGAPAANVTLRGIFFTGAAASFLMPHGLPAGGDWALARVGAVTAEGALGLAIADCTFSRLDGNAVVLNGWNRGARVEDCEFELLGESAVVSWGRVDGADARALTQPWGTVVARNLCSGIGLYEKQASCYFATLTGGAEVEGNIFYNLPRAAILFNDDMGGGSTITRNLLFNSCSETSDHGPINSWGRTPYIINFANGSASGGVKPAVDVIAYNFLAAGGGANSGAADHDDGSAFYNDHHNLMVYGGHKSNWGHAKRSEANLMVFPLVYKNTCMRQFPFLPPASPGGRFAEAYVGNTCILAAAGDTYLDLGSDCAPGPALASQIVLANNSVFAPPGAGTASVLCGRATVSFEDWVASGSEPGSTLAGVPPTAQIIEWARALLSIPAQAPTGAQ
jgi:hypothetical protein